MTKDKTLENMVEKLLKSIEKIEMKQIYLKKQKRTKRESGKTF